MYSLYLLIFLSIQYNLGAYGYSILAFIFDSQDCTEASTAHTNQFSIGGPSRSLPILQAVQMDRLQTLMNFLPAFDAKKGQISYFIESVLPVVPCSTGQVFSSFPPSDDDDDFIFIGQAKLPHLPSRRLMWSS